jgi:hypothetical protein
VRYGRIPRRRRESPARRLLRRRPRRPRRRTVRPVLVLGPTGRSHPPRRDGPARRGGARDRWPSSTQTTHGRSHSGRGACSSAAHRPRGRSQPGCSGSPRPRSAGAGPRRRCRVLADLRLRDRPPARRRRVVTRRRAGDLVRSVTGCELPVRERDAGRSSPLAESHETRGACRRCPSRSAARASTTRRFVDRSGSATSRTRRDGCITLDYPLCGDRSEVGSRISTRSGPIKTRPDYPASTPSIRTNA